MKKTSILFLVTGISGRSQMAEGWLRHLKGDKFSAYSAGIQTHGLNPNAVAVMREAGGDISQQQSQTLDQVGVEPDVIITVCGHADETCPVLPARTKKIHSGFDDPPKLAKNAKTEEEALEYYRRVRDEIRCFVESIEAVI